MSGVLRQPAVEGITDLATRESIQWIFDFIKEQSFLRGNFQHMVFEFKKADTNVKLPHGLGFRPLDVIQTSLTGLGVVTFNYALFDATNIVISATNPCVVRFFVGRYQNV